MPVEMLVLFYLGEAPHPPPPSLLPSIFKSVYSLSVLRVYIAERHSVTSIVASEEQPVKHK